MHIFFPCVGETAVNWRCSEELFKQNGVIQTILPALKGGEPTYVVDVCHPRWIDWWMCKEHDVSDFLWWVMGWTYKVGRCQCLPDCAGKECGDDGCGGACGECLGPNEMCDDGQCVCLPDCLGKVCGDDGCGGECLPGCGKCACKLTPHGSTCVNLCHPDCPPGQKCVGCECQLDCEYYCAGMGV